MLGWNSSVHRFNDPELRDARGDLQAIEELLKRRYGVDEVPDSQVAGERYLAVWQSGIGGISWLDELAQGGHALKTSHCGYPESYVIRAGAFKRQREEGLPDEKASWTFGHGDVVDFDLWVGKTAIDLETLRRVPDDEWLLVEAWDES
jgi:hypothetical protein